MIHAGIDEAGLGPTLGPLVTAATAFAVPDDWRGRPEKLWEELSGAISGKASKKDVRLVVADSKAAYAAGGLAVLEAAVAGFLSRLGGTEAALRRLDLAARTAGGCRWHECSGRAFPLFPGSPGGSGLAEEMRLAGIGIVHLQCRALHPREFNAAVSSGLNKNQTLLNETGCRIRELVDLFAPNGIEIWIDKQGGRNDYLPWLSALFPGVWIDVVAAGKDESEYRLRLREGPARLHFCAKADRFSFTTALASMAAKYVRERLMLELNAWFGERIEGLRPTAGYPEDAKRWLRDAAAFLVEAKIDEQTLVRMR